MSKASGKPGPDPGAGGRPRKEIDIAILDNLCKIQCTQEEICNVLGCSRNIIKDRIREVTGNPEITFMQYFRQKADHGKVSLRRRQWKLSEKNVAMAIFLGKQYLGQKDIKEITAKHDITTMDIKLTPEEEVAYKKRMESFLGGAIEEDIDMKE